jgi:hypothetical protein
MLCRSEVAEMKGGEKGEEGSGLGALGEGKDMRGCIVCSVVPNSVVLKNGKHAMQYCTV